MKKKLLLLTCAGLLAIANKARGQTNSSLIDFNRHQQRTTKAGMMTLGSWAVGNFAVSGLSLSKPQDSRYYFHQMNLFWNVVNVTLAGIGYVRATRKDISSLSLSQTIKDHHSLRRTLLFNAGLDVGYMAGGLYLLEKAKNATKQAARWRGYGRSLILQGGFLLAFDTIFYLVVRSEASGLLDAIIRKLTVNSQGIGFVHRF